jgi:RNA polymerase sigma-70 factor (ECF subfamily)
VSDHLFEDHKSLKQLTEQKELLNMISAEKIHKEYSKLVYYFIRIFALPDDCIDDLFNQIFLKVVKGLAELDDARNIKSWVITITKNEIYNFLNKRNRELNRRVLVDDVVMSGYHSATQPPSPDQEHEVFIAQINRYVEAKLPLMDEKYSKPLLLRYRNGLKWKEVADHLCIKEDTARKRGEKAITIIRELLEEELGEGFTI